jgi:hypothetical protein
MAIDFSDPAQTTHHDKTIPINTQAKFDAGLKVMQALYAFVGVPWSDTAANAYEQRVRNGLTMKEIIVTTYDEYLTRMGNTPGAAGA